MRSPSSHLGAAGPAGQRVGRSLAKPWKREGRCLPTAPSSRGSKLRPQRWGLDSRVPGPVSTTTRVLVCLGTLTLSSRCPAGLCAPCFQLKIMCWFKLDILLTVCPSGWLALGTGPALSPSPQHLLRPLVYSRCSTHSFDVNIAHGASLIAQLVENPPAMRETWVPSLGWEDPWRRDRLPTPVFLGFPDSSAGRESARNAGDLGSIPGLGGSPGGCNPRQCSGLEHPRGQRSLAGCSPRGRSVRHDGAADTQHTQHGGPMEAHTCFPSPPVCVPWSLVWSPQKPTLVTGAKGNF